MGCHSQKRRKVECRAIANTREFCQIYSERITEKLLVSSHFSYHPTWKTLTQLSPHSTTRPKTKWQKVWRAQAWQTWHGLSIRMLLNCTQQFDAFCSFSSQSWFLISLRDSGCCLKCNEYVDNHFKTSSLLSEMKSNYEVCSVPSPVKEKGTVLNATVLGLLYFNLCTLYALCKVYL